jgi:hypothetical protein
MRLISLPGELHEGFHSVDLGIGATAVTGSYFAALPVLRRVRKRMAAEFTR